MNENKFKGILDQVAEMGKSDNNHCCSWNYRFYNLEDISMDKATDNKKIK